MTDEEFQQFARRTDLEFKIRSFVSSGGLLLVFLAGALAFGAWWLL
jgi:hypothetical protein